jgi:hypothetical protein
MIWPSRALRGGISRAHQPAGWMSPGRRSSTARRRVATFDAAPPGLLARPGLADVSYSRLALLHVPTCNIEAAGGFAPFMLAGFPGRDAAPYRAGQLLDRSNALPDQVAGLLQAVCQKRGSG